jgi:PAS domain S-box-containing protein
MARRRTFKVIHIEDNPLDQRLIADMLSQQETSRYTLDSASTLAKGKELLGAGSYDLILLDLNLPDSRRTNTLEEIVGINSSLPLIVISGIDDEAAAMEALDKGAHDYLLKGHFDSAILTRSIRYAMHHKHLEESLRRTQETLKLQVEERTNELIETNQELTRTADQYRSLFNDSIEALFTLDRKGCFAEVNDVFVKLTGYPKEETIGANFRKGMNDEDAQRITTFYRQMRKSGEPIRDLGFTLIRKDGTKRAAVISANILYKDGDFAGFLGALRDVTEHKKAEEELQRSEELFRSLFHRHSAVKLIIDPDTGRIVDANEAAVRFYGWPIERLKKMKIHDVNTLPPHEVGKEMEKAKSQKAVHFEFRHKKADGSVRDVEVFSSRIEARGKALLHSIIHDVTDRRLAEEALRESEVRYRQVVENAQEAIVVFVDGVVVYANPMTEQITGYPIEELRGKVLQDITLPEDNEPAAREFRRKLGGDSVTYSSEYRYVKKSGDIGWYEAIAVSIVWDGKPGIMVFAREVTERKKLEEQFLQTQKMDAIGAMAGGIAHNFNNILVGIMGYSEFLLHDKSEDHPEYKALKTIFEGTLKASQLTRELLNVTRAGEYRLVGGNINVIVESILPLIAGAFDKSIEIKTILADGLPSFEVDAAYMQQCLLNLCINARDAMPDGGTLAIETYRKYLDGGFVRTHIGSREGEHLVLSVSDTGTGMTQEVKDHLFEPFFTTKLDAGGTGMGLSTVYGTMKKHGGFITVYSEPGHGTTFNLYFPVSRGAVKEDREAGGKDHRGGHETILIIDDEPVVRTVWMEYLLRKGYRVLLAENGEQGVALFKEHRDTIDLVILDVIMPKMGGKETLAAIREVAPAVRVLITSGYALNGKAGELDMSRVEGFVQKPATLKEFSEKIRTILDGAG